ncbi:DNA ligase D [Paraburkholderia silvatlantica]|uniref:DNA ligase (ATP) n=1 Tax=Paraburkholderia silvatlantica TaxID=321895 RepID=A0ABR6FHQ2_9BURK|nr:DNA ligase D [Paraburkholderia silvatlantica]MBB2926945.1 bifunctional non-homologous end joining protein LigD [Paraburkholderia silvatlantica]PVY37433.1 ATP-dependent DNA ligase LigD phosphoesterase module /ATP-dependent DNA ligase LigD polymerase module [Paraburkholderia silvatlantica]PXW42395.1 ATP-dependent DNA ligase LigD phosphoesterase module /ATP-dependent DNA ligase LigD polymerase module [Paraburkholderia silvatlantica]
MASTRDRNPPSPPLSRYRKKRDFDVTPEPAPLSAHAPAENGPLGFVVQKHWASRLHYDFRLELDGVLLSWAVPKGPCYDPKEKRMAIHVEDHPVDYAVFEGTIPAKQYGAGDVIVWDRGTWEPVGDPREGMTAGKLVFRLHGEKLAGLWELVRISRPGDRQDPWMLFKKRDAWAQPLADYDVIKALPDSVTARPLGLIEERAPRVARPASSASSEIDLGAAVSAPLPARLEPQLATLAPALPARGNWIAEAKLDGYRMLSRVAKGRVRLITRGGQDWTAKFPALAAEVEALALGSAWLDGEITVLEDGIPSFAALQDAIDGNASQDIVYFLFDLVYLNGKDLRKVPLWSRRRLLAQLLAHAGEHIRFSQDFEAPPAQLFEAASGLGLEGLMLKRRDAPYESGRTQTWLKAKSRFRQELVICGFTGRGGKDGEVGSLLLGYYADGKLHDAGSVGTGWDARTARDLWARLAPLEVDAAPFDTAVARPRRWARRSAGSERWVRPELVAEVEFADWTADGVIRQASFRGLRIDKPATGVIREGGKTQAPQPQPKLKITHPERVVDPSTGITKADLVRYYASIAERMLPHLLARPVTMVRAPAGIAEELFFQKHAERTGIPGLTAHDRSLWPDHPPLLTIDTVDALLSAAQMNAVEFHTWNSTVRRLEKPDRVIFDLDPGEGVKWGRVQEAALLVQTLLSELGLQAWLKTSGAKGLHVVVPLAPQLGYDPVKAFSQAFVRHLAKTIPERFSATSGASNRVGKIYVDYLRNGKAQTTAAAFSARARPAMGVSMPVSWAQLNDLKGGAQWTVQTAREYLSFQQQDPWADYWTGAQSLASAIKLLK